MCSSPPNPTKHRQRVDWADCLGSISGAGGLIVLTGLAGLWLWSGPPSAAPGEVQLVRETTLRVSLVSMPEVAAPEPERIEAVLPEPEPDPLPEPAPVPREERVLEVLPPPLKEPAPAEVPPLVEAAPEEAVQTPVKEEGAAGREAAIRNKWLSELRCRIEQSKFYPGAARYSRETGTVLLRVEIEPTAAIGEVRLLENSGSTLLAEGAMAILRRVGGMPLGSNELPSGFQVEVPITYQVDHR